MTARTVFTSLLASTAMLVSAIVGSGPAQAAPAPIDLSQTPVDCAVAGLSFDDPRCLTQTRLGTFELSPRIVRAGGTLTGRITPAGDFPITWPAELGRQTWDYESVDPCTSTTTTCVWRIPAGAKSSTWTIVTVGLTNNQGLGISKDYFAIVGRGDAVLSGALLDAAGAPLSGVTIRIRGTQKATVTTNAAGQYQVILKRGRYTVTPVSGTLAFTPQATSQCRVVAASCIVRLTGDRAASFTGTPR